MSERGKRAASNGLGLGKAVSTSDGKRFAAGLQKVASDLEALCKSGDGVQDYGDLLSSQAALKQDTQKWQREVARLQKDVEDLRVKRDEDVGELQRKIAELDQYKDRLTVDYGEKYKAWDADKRRHADDLNDLAQLRKKLEVKTVTASKLETEYQDLCEERKALAGELEKRSSDMEALKELCDMKELELKRATRQLDECRKKAEETKDQLGILPLDFKRLRQKLEELATGLHELMWDYFGNHTLQPVVPVDVSGTSLARIPQPASNSPASKAMRCAIAEALVASELSRCIFTDLHVSDGMSGVPSGELARVLAWLDSSHPLEATVTRCQLARALARSSGVEQCASQAAERVCTTLEPWFGSDDRRQRFEADLTKRFGASMALWLPVQRAEQRLRAETDVACIDWLYEEDRRPRYDIVTPGENNLGGSGGSSIGQGHNAAPEIPLAVLFPHIYVGKAILFQGLSLFADQPAVAAARLEARKQPESRANRASHGRNSHCHPQVSGQSTKGSRRPSVSSVESSRTRGSLVGGAASSDLSSVRRPRSHIDGTATEVGV